MDLWAKRIVSLLLIIGGVACTEEGTSDGVEGRDAVIEARPDRGADLGSDIARDVGSDVLVDAASDAMVDAAPDATLDATPDTGLDAALGDGGPPRLPDLVLLRDRLTNDIWLDQKEFTEDSCAMIEGCVDGTGVRTLLRFSVVTANVGEADLVFGRPRENESLFEYSACHDHFHFEEYADYALKDEEEAVVAVGHKQAFCLMDSEQHLTDDPSVREQARYNCAFQGISRGWEDRYGSHLDCQWIDVTDVAPGPYRLDVVINGERVIEEMSYENNAASTAVEVPPLDISLPCRGVQLPGKRRSCGWTMDRLGACEQGHLVEIGCGGCDLGTACQGDPMVRVCDGEMTQCLPSMALANRNGGCGENDCPHTEFLCPESGLFTVWTNSNIDGDAYGCDLAVRAGPPRIVEPCEGEERGFQRTCGWDLALDNAECRPGFPYRVGCNPGMGECHLGVRCEGDPIMRVCDGATPCLTGNALAEIDDACDTRCPAVEFECPLSGHFSVFTAAYRTSNEYACEVEFTVLE